MSLTGINQDLKTKKAQGGLRRLMYIDLASIDLAGSTADNATKKVTLAVTASPNKVIYIGDENTALLNSNGAQDGNNHVSNIEGLIEFPSVTAADILEANLMSEQKAGVLIGEYANCNVLVFGLDIVTGCSASTELRRSLQRLKPIVSVVHGTIGDDDKTIFAFEGSQNSVALMLDTATQTFDQLAAL
jgi:hypothetical protein